MANHRWDTEPPAVLPSRLAARRRAVAVDSADARSEPGRTDFHSGAVAADGAGAWQLPDRDGCEPESSTDPPVPTENPRRWGFPLRAGILAACLMLAAAAAVPLLRDRASSEVLSVELGSNLAAAGSDGPQATGRPGTNETDEANPQVPQGEREAVHSGEAAASGEADALGSTAGSTADSPAGGGAQLVVHVAGAVADPGLVRIPDGSRVADAVAAAGGATAEADLTRVNLAAPMTDGSMVVIPAQGDPGGPVAAPGSGSAVQVPPGPAAGTGSGGGASVVNLNTAGEVELQTLPRVGPVLAARIIAWRTEHGPFQRAEDLDAVPGIGEAMLAALLPLVAV